MKSLNFLEREFNLSGIPDNQSFDDIVNSVQSNVYSCTIWIYVPGHSQMLIRAIETSQPTTTESIYFLLKGVVFFSGPMRWQGNFKIGDSRECLEILGSIEVTENTLSREGIRENFRLIKISGSTNVMIVSDSINIFKQGELPAIKSWLVIPPII